MTTYFIIDAQGNFVTTDTDEVIAKAIATELGGDYYEIGA